MSLIPSAFLTAAATALLCVPMAAQHGDHHGHQNPAAKVARTGDPYPFETCPVSGKKLGAMGDPEVKVYDGREVRFCCGGCTGKFEKDLDASFAKLDQKVLADQRPIYPLTKSVVSGEKLPEKPVSMVLGNRLILVATAKEKATILKAPEKYLKLLDDAVKAAQGKDYPLKKCVVSDEPLGSMGKAKDVVVAGRLIRLCCASCTKKLEKTPAAFLATIDKAAADKSPEEPRDGKKE